MNYHDYIWDLGGTLLDNYEMSTQAFVKTLADFGCQASHDDVYEKLKESTDAAIKKFIPNQPQFLKAYKALEADYLKTPVLFTGASEVLQVIVASGGRNFLVSHRNKQVLDILEKTKVLPYFTEVVTSESGFARKPSPESMLYLKEKYKIDEKKLEPYQNELRELITNNNDFINQFRNDKVVFSEASRSELIKFQQTHNKLFNEIIIAINDSE